MFCRQQIHTMKEVIAIDIEEQNVSYNKYPSRVDLLSVNLTNPKQQVAKNLILVFGKYV